MNENIIISLIALLGILFNSIMACISNEKAEKNKKVIQSIHILVNSNMGAQLKISALALRRIALLTNDKEDKEAAKLAAKLLHEHDEKQNEVEYVSSLAP